jgi:hypothetical protein
VQPLPSPFPRVSTASEANSAHTREKIRGVSSRHVLRA